MELCLIFLSYLTLIVNGVFGDEVKSVSVMEGHSLTLHTDVIKQRDDLIVWYYGPEHTLVAKINGEANSIKFSEDEIFRDRVKLNNQTGDLIITHITSQHSGLYTLRIYSNNEVSNKKFNLTVNGRLPVLPLNHIIKHTQDLDNTQLCLECSKSPDQRVIIAVSCTAVFCVIIIIIISIIIFMKRRKAISGKSSVSENHLNEEKRSISSISTSEDEESSKCLSTE